MIRRMAFKRRLDYIVVKPIYPSRGGYTPGTIINCSQVRGTILRWWYRKGLIAVVGCPWGEAMLEKVTTELRALELESDKKTDQEGSEESDDAEDDDEELEIVQEGAGYYTLKLDGEVVDRVRGKKNLQAWLEENGYDA